MPADPCLLACLVADRASVHCAQALSPLLISVLWAAFAMVPPFLLVSYAAVGGPGVIMRILCFFCGIVSTCAGLAAVGILWAIPR